MEKPIDISSENWKALVVVALTSIPDDFDTIGQYYYAMVKEVGRRTSFPLADLDVSANTFDPEAHDRKRHWREGTTRDKILGVQVILADMN